MSIIKKAQKQKLVYWELIDSNENGELIWAPPVEYKCRWDTTIKQMQTGESTVVISEHRLITEVELKVGGMVYRGTLSEIANLSEPKNNSDVYEIQMVSRTPDIKNRKILYQARA